MKHAWKFIVTNLSGIDLNYLITSQSPTSVYYNAQGMMQMGTHIYTQIFCPDQPVQVGGTLSGSISAWHPDPENFHCLQFFTDTIVDYCDKIEEDDGFEEVDTTIITPYNQKALMKTSVLQLYPNPTQEGVWVAVTTDTTGSKEEKGAIVVRNIVGQIMAERAIVADGTPIYLSLHKLTAGVYTVEYRIQDMLLAIEKLVKQ